MSKTLQEWAGASRIVALVFTDVVDSTTLGNALGDEEWIEVLRKHFEEARFHMSFHDCHEIKIIGDSFMVAFRTAVDALDFALAFQAYTGDERIRIRVGVHVGPVRIIENDMFGMMVNYTKRVESTDNLHFIMLSNEAKNHIDYEKARHHSHLRFRPRSITFKGFSEPQRIWLVIYPELLKLIRAKQAALEQTISSAKSKSRIVSPTKL